MHVLVRTMNKLISIIIPALNEEDSILLLLDALRRQSFRPGKFEVVVVDNNSTDRTAARVLRYKRRHPALSIVLTKESTPHVSAARNKGASVAVGKCLVFLDADNLVSEDFVKHVHQKAFVERHEAGTIFSMAMEDVGRGHKIFLLLELAKLFGPKPFGKSFCSRRVFAKAGGFNQGIAIGTNLDFLTRVRRVLRREGKELAHIPYPIFVSLRRFEKHGYATTLLKWFWGYIGVRGISYTNTYREERPIVPDEPPVRSEVDSPKGIYIIDPTLL